MQAIFDLLSENEKLKRSHTQMNLANLLDRLYHLIDLYPNLLIGLENPHSYRGYYSDLSLEPSPKGQPISDLILELESVYNTHLTGYKGGEFLMDKLVPVWVAYYGNTGVKLMEINDDGALVTEEETW